MQIIRNENTGASTTKQTLQTLIKKLNTGLGLLSCPEAFKALRQRSFPAEAGVKQSLLLPNILQTNDLWQLPGERAVLCFFLLGKFVAELRYLSKADDRCGSVSECGYFCCF